MHLKHQDAEIVLDTKVAELAAPLKCGGYARGAPWADGELLGPDSFRKGNPSDIFGQIARFSVENDIDVVLEDIGDNYSRSKPLYRSTKQQSNENLNHE